MNRFVALFSIFFVSNKILAECPKLNGRFEKCKAYSKIISKTDLWMINLALKGYRVELTSADFGHNILTSYKKPFSSRVTLSNDFIEVDSPRVLNMENSHDGSTPPELRIHTYCKNNRLIEEIEWVNLNTDHYESNYVKKTPRFYNSIWSMKGNKLRRELEIRVKDENGIEAKEFLSIGHLLCSPL